MKRTRDSGDITAMIARMLTALGRRLRDGDPADLAQLAELRQRLDSVTAATIHHLHDEQQFTWQAIADALGCSRQNAYQRWGRSPSTAVVDADQPELPGF